MSLIKNNIIVLIGIIISNVFAFLFHFISGRYLGPAQYGELGALMAFMVLLSMPSSAVNFALSKFISVHYENNEFSQIHNMVKKLIKKVFYFSSFVFLILFFFISPITTFLNVKSSSSIIIIGLSFFIIHILGIQRGLIQGMKYYNTFAWNVILEATARLAFLSVLFFFSFSVSGVLSTFVLGYFIAYLFLVFPKKITLFDTMKTTTYSLENFNSLFYKILIFNLLVQVIINSPPIIVNYFYSNELAGYWTSTLNIAKISLLVPLSISIVMIPEIVGLNEFSDKLKVFVKSALMTIFLTSCFAIILFFFPKIILSTLYGKEFLDGSTLLQWMGIAMIFLSIIQLYIHFLLTKD